MMAAVAQRVMISNLAGAQTAVKRIFAHSGFRGGLNPGKHIFCQFVSVCEYDDGRHITAGREFGL